MLIPEWNSKCVLRVLFVSFFDFNGIRNIIIVTVQVFVDLLELSKKKLDYIMGIHLVYSIYILVYALCTVSTRYQGHKHNRNSKQTSLQSGERH